MAVVRIWHGKVPIEKADDYERFLIDKAAPDYTREGLQKLYFLRRNEDNSALPPNNSLGLAGVDKKVCKRA